MYRTNGSNAKPMAMCAESKERGGVTALVEPPVAMIMTMAFSKAAAVMMSFGFRSICKDRRKRAHNLCRKQMT